MKRFKLHSDTPPGASRIKRHPIILKLLEEQVQLEGRSLIKLLKKWGGKKFNEWVKRRSLPLIVRLKKLKEFAKQQQTLSARHVKLIEKAIEDSSDPVAAWIDLLTDSDLLEKLLQREFDRLSMGTQRTKMACTRTD